MDVSDLCRIWMVSDFRSAKSSLWQQISFERLLKGESAIVTFISNLQFLRQLKSYILMKYHFLLSQTCSDLFGDIFNAKHIEDMVDDTNSYYGAKDLEVENVVFVHGSIDPWHAMGRTTDLNKDAPAIMIQGNSNLILGSF